jgi:hypothetical protein
MAIDIRLYFDCASKETYVSDYTNYESIDFPVDLIVSNSGSLVDPNNLNVFTQEPLITVDTYQFPNNSSNFPLPILLGSSGNVVPGNYTFNYTNTYTWNSEPEDRPLEFTSDYVKVPTVNLATIWAIGDTFEIENAVEAQNNGIFTITDIQWGDNNNMTYIFVAPDTFISSDGELDPEASIILQKSQVVYQDKVYTYTNCASVTPCITANYDCTSTPFGNITFQNSTTMPTGVVATSSDFKIYYPNGLDFSASPNPDNFLIENPLEVEDVNSVTITTLATGTWSAKLILRTSQTQNDGLILINSSSVIKEFNVSCTSNMCGLSSCLTKLRDRHISYLKSSSVSPLQQYVDNVQLLYTMAKEAQACGDKNAYERYIAEIFEVVKQTDTDCGCGCSGSCSGSCSCGDCSSGCGCGETGPTWVNNTGIDIRSALEALGDLPARVAALEGSVTNIITDISSLNEWTGIENWQVGGPTFYQLFQTLQSSTSDLGPEVEGNSLQIIDLTARVDALEEQIANLGSSNSEVSVYELMTNSGTQKSVWTATSGSATSSITYNIVISGNVTDYFTPTTNVSFYNPPTAVWFYGEVINRSYSGGSTNIELSWGNPDFDNGASWQTSLMQFLVYKGNMSTSEYNFKQTLTLENDAYWKFDTANVKYWSKIKASFVVNEPTISNQLPIFTIKNSNSNQSVLLRSIPCGTIVDLELSFEKLYYQSSDLYDCVTLIDAKYNTSDNIALSEDGAILFGGHSGFNPSTGFGIDLNAGNNGNYYELGIPESLENASSVQDVVNNSGDGTFGVPINSNRKVTRYATGPSYPNSVSPNFFTGSQAETVVFNFDNINITLFNIEHSFGKMQVSQA